MTCVSKTVIFLINFTICAVQVSCQTYQDLEPTVEALFPKGFKVTLKDDDYTFFGFRGNINKKINHLDKGEINQDIISSKSDYWVYNNSDVMLNIGDKIYYWIYVLKKNGKGYTKTDLEYTVTGFVTEDGKLAPGEPNVIQSPRRTLPPRDFINSYDASPSSCTISKTQVRGRSTVCKNTLIFNEEFEKTSLQDLQKWDAVVKFPEEPDYPFNVYIPDKTVSFQDGSFVITPVLTESQREVGFLYQSLDLGVRCTGKLGTTECKQVASGAQILPPATTAKITTRRSFNFKFGRIEVRAKLSSGSWVMPEINLEPSDNTYGQNNYESGLMRIAFVRGNPDQAKKLYGGPVLTNSEPFRSMLLQEKIGIDNWHKDFHNYTMIWKPDGIELLVDGEQYGSINPGGGFFETAKVHDVPHAWHWQIGTVMAPLDEMFHLALGVRVGGINDFHDKLEDKPWKNTGRKAVLDFWNARDSWHPSWYDGALTVDYVRVYAL